MKTIFCFSRRDINGNVLIFLNIMILVMVIKCRALPILEYAVTVLNYKQIIYMEQI